MNFNLFIEFLNSLYIEEVEIATRVNSREINFNRMVFSDDFQEDPNNMMVTESNRRQAMRTARCVKILGKGVVKVVHRCNDAKESNNLDLSECQLMQMPDAIYHLMRETNLLSCSLASNVISKLPPKFPLTFNLLTELDLSNNRMSRLPSEFSACTQLETINISSNSFVTVPPVLFELPALAKLDASKNFIADVEIEAVTGPSNLELVNLEDNPIDPNTYDRLSEITSIRIILSPRERQEWEDLSI